MIRQTFLALSLIAAAGSASAAVSNEDRSAYARHRLLELALSQSRSYSGHWDPGQRDCAGLVRFLFREAVAGRGPIWKDRKGQPAHFVKADELVGFNFHKISERFDPSRLRTGDLLVYQRPDRKPEDSWHLMILLEPPAYSRKEWLAIYHNGDRGPKGEVRIVSLRDLQSTVHSEWRPLPMNPAFLGVYRWNGWNDSKN